MTKKQAICCFLLLCVYMSGVVAIFDTISTGEFKTYLTNNIEGTTQIRQDRFYLPNRTGSFTIVPCYGPVDWDISFSNNIGSDTYSIPWLREVATINWEIPEGPDYGPIFVNFTFTCRSNTNDNNGNCVVFDLFAYAPPASLTQYIPTPGQGGAIGKPELSSGGKSGSFEFFPSSSPSDEYEIYTTTNKAPAGYFISTACSIRSWMSNTTLKPTQDGSFLKVSFSSLNPKTPLTAVVVLNRPGNYSSAYNSFTFNGVEVIIPSMILILFSFIALIL